MTKPINHPLYNIVANSLIKLPSPSNLSYSWNWGSMLGVVLVIQILSGLFLSMHYAANTLLAFSSVLLLSRDIFQGWNMRMIHMNGASLFFVFIYLHILSGMTFNSFKLKETWMSGITIFLILMITSFVGYVLPWGQMSFWGTSVITNFLSVIPLVGKEIVKWVWGGFSVSNPTLNRFFSIHFILPFITAAIILIHLASLHLTGSSNPNAIPMNLDKLPFHQFFSIKDLLSSILILVLFLTVCLLLPLSLGDPENFNPANPLSTPPHIQPEWYFLFAYAILRSIPNKLGGVIALAMSIMALYPMILSKSPIKTKKFTPVKNWLMASFAMVFVMLTWIGANPVEDPMILTGQIMSIAYFSLILCIQ